jgi:hypothetical protein
VRRGVSRFLVAVTLGAVVLAAAACSSGPTTLSAQLKSWATNATYSADVAQISEDLIGLRNGLDEHEFLQTRTECEGFGVDVETLYGELPTPDQTITDELGASLSSYYSASEDCFYSSSFTSSQFKKYERLMVSAGKTYFKAVGQLDAYLSGPTLSGKLQVWAANANYDADAEQISEDVTALQGDLKARQLAALKTECGSFGVDVDALYDQLPTPDQTITAELHSSLDDFETASRDCSGSSSLASAKIQTYKGLMSRADRTYQRALSQLVTHGVQ